MNRLQDALRGGGKLILDSKGEISIKATKALNIEAAKIKMSTTTGKFEAKATQDLNLSGCVKGRRETHSVHSGWGPEFQRIV